MRKRTLAMVAVIMAAMVMVASVAAISFDYLTDEVFDRIPIYLVEFYSDNEVGRPGKARPGGFGDICYDVRNIVFQEYEKENNINVYDTGIRDFIFAHAVKRLSSLPEIYAERRDDILFQMYNLAYKNGISPEAMFAFYANMVNGLLGYVNFALGPKREELAGLNKEVTEALEKEKAVFVEKSESRARFFKKWALKSELKEGEESSLKKLGQEYWEESLVVLSADQKHSSAEKNYKAKILALESFVESAGVKVPNPGWYEKYYVIRWVDRRRNEGSLEKIQQVLMDLSVHLKEPSAPKS